MQRNDLLVDPARTSGWGSSDCFVLRSQRLVARHSSSAATATRDSRRRVSAGLGPRTGHDGRIRRRSARLAQLLRSCHARVLAVERGQSCRPLSGDGIHGLLHDAGKLSGTWYREANGMVITVTLAGDEMKICTTMSDDTHTACVTLTADYAITKEGIVHGIVTGADVSGKSLGNGDGSPGDGPLEASAEYQKLVDCPFSFRAKMTSAGVMISNFKMAAADLDKDDLAMACGLYKPRLMAGCHAQAIQHGCFIRTVQWAGRRDPDSACLPPVAMEVVTRTIPDAVRIMPAPTPPGRSRADQRREGAD